jgi:hypothetical protein
VVPQAAQTGWEGSFQPFGHRWPNPPPCRKWHHGSVSSPRRTRNKDSTSTSLSTMTRRPFALTMSIRPQPDPLPFQTPKRSSPAQIRGHPARYALRHENKAGLKSRADAPSPSPAVGPTNSPQPCESLSHPAIDGDDPCQESKDD